MDLIFRSFIVFILLLAILRLSGKRTLSQVTTFDFVLLLIIGEATQQALLGDDKSIMGALLVIGTLVGLDLLFIIFSKKFDKFDKVANGVPVIIFSDGKPLKDRMDEARVKIDDILEVARKTHGIDDLSQVKYAVLEKDGAISVVLKN